MSIVEDIFNEGIGLPNLALEWLSSRTGDVWSLNSFPQFPYSARNNYKNVGENNVISVVASKLL